MDPRVPTVRAALAVLASGGVACSGPTSTPSPLAAADAYLTSLLAAARGGAGDHASSLLPLAGSLLAPAADACTDHERHFALQLVRAATLSTADSLASGRPGGPIPPADLAPLQAALAGLLRGSRGVEREALHVKESIADVVAGVAERLWPQRWPGLVDELVASAAASRDLLDLVARALRTVATDAGDADCSGHLPGTRRSELLQALTAVFLPTLAAPLVGELARCAAELGAAAAAPLILCAAILDLLGSLIPFLPPASIRAASLCAAVYGVVFSAGRALAPSAGAPADTALHAHADRLHRSVVGVLGALASRKFEGPDVDLAVASVDLAAAVLDGTASLAFPSPSPLAARTAYPTFRSIAAAGSDVFARHLPTACEAASSAPSAAASCARALPVLARLVAHPSALVRAAALGPTGDLLRHPAFADLPAAESFAAAVRPLLLASCEREGRFARVPPASFAAGAASAEARSRPAAASSLSPDAAEAQAVRSADFAGDEADEYLYAFEVQRARASKALAALARFRPDMAATLVRDAAEHGAALAAAGFAQPGAAARASLSPDEDSRAISAFGTSTSASRAYRFLDAAAYAAEAVVSALPAPSLVPGTPCSTALAAACRGLLAAGIVDPLLRTRVALFLAACGGRLFPSAAAAGAAAAAAAPLLPATLDLLFAYIEARPDPRALSAAAAAGSACAQQLLLDTQYARQNGCQALVALARRAPGALLPALQPLSARALALIASSRGEARLLTAADSVSLYELMVLVSNAMAEPDPAAHATFLGSLLTHAVSGAADPALAGAVASPQGLLAYLGLAGGGSGAAGVLERCEDVQHILHVLWAVARRSTAEEASGGDGHAGGRKDRRGAGGGAAPAAASSGAGPAGAPSPLGERLDLPTHPFSAHWPTVLSLVAPLHRSLLALWGPDSLAALLAPLPSPPAPSPDLPAAARFLVALSGEEGRVLAQAAKSDDDARGERKRGAVGTRAGKGAGGGNGENEDDDDDDDSDEDGSDDEDERSRTAGETFVPVVLGQGAGGLALQPVLLSEPARELASRLAVWHMRCLWHTNALLTLAATSHLLPRLGRTVCPLSDVQAPPSRSAQAAAAAAAVSSHSAPAGPAPRPVDDALVAAVWSRSGLFSGGAGGGGTGSFLPAAGPALRAALAADTVARLPLRIHRALLLQLVPGLLEGCPPTAAAAAQLGALLAPLVSAAHDGVAAVNAALEAAAAAQEAPSSSTSAAAAAAMAAARCVGFTLPSGGGGGAALPLDVVCDAIARDTARALCDVVLTAAPPTETWYALTRDGGASAVQVPAAVPASAAPIVSRTLLFHAPSGEAFARVLAGVVGTRDGTAVRKACLAWERVLAALAALGGSGGTSTPASASAWLHAAASFFTAAVEALCLGRPWATAVEGDLTGPLTDILCLTACGLPAATPGPLVGSSGGGGGGGGQGAGGSAAAARPPPTPVVPRVTDAPARFLASLPGVGADEVSALLGRIATAGGGKDRKAALRDLLQAVAARVAAAQDAAAEAAGPGGAALAKSRRAGAAVRDLPDRLVLLGRGATGGRGSSARVESEPLDDGGPIGLGNLFGEG
jgi:hypothetical protein